MNWFLLVQVVVLMGFLGWLLRRFKKDHDIATKHIKHAYLRTMFLIADEKRESYEHYVKTRMQIVPQRQPGESSWNYLSRVAAEERFGLVPSDLPWVGTRDVGYGYGDTVHTDAVIKCWTATVKGVVHRVSKLHLLDGSVVDVLLCDPSDFITSDFITVEIHEHDINECPALTCLSCLVRV